MDTIDGMKTFVAVAKKKSFTAGAKVLGMSTKLASKYVAQLEAKLGAQLFHRTTRSVTLTETGRAYFTRCISILDQIDELEGVIQERQLELSGPIRLTASTAFGSHHLVEALSPFQREHPNVSIDLHLSDQVIPIVEDGFDLAIRFGGLNDSALIARKLMDMRIIVCASPEYLANHGEPQHPSELADHNCLLQRTSGNPATWRFLIDGESVAIAVNGAFKTNSPRAIARMAADGLGIGICPMYVAQFFLRQDQLRILFADKEVPGYSLYAVYPPSRHLTARVRKLIDHLSAYFQQSKIGTHVDSR